MTFTHPLAGIMDKDGMLPGDWPCLRCGRKLNADGNHPAELYAGSWNGLCYPCTKAGPYVAGISTLDGIRQLSWPPHCPSWRRDREKFYGYPGCQDCEGLGVTGYRYSSSGRTSCKRCMDQWMAHPVRVALEMEYKRIRDDYQALYTAMMCAALRLPKKISDRKRTAAINAMDAVDCKVIRWQVQEWYRRDVDEHLAGSRWADSWRMPTPEEQI